MRLREFLGGVWGIPIPGTEKAVGLKKVTRKYMGKVRTFYEPTNSGYENFIRERLIKNWPERYNS